MCLQMKPVTSVERIRGHTTVTHASGNDLVCESEAEHEVDRSAKEGVMAKPGQNLVYISGELSGLVC